MIPSVSVVVPTHDRASLLPRLIGAWLAQEADFELIVVNDGSSDETRAVLDGVTDARVIVIHQVNAGPAVARNRGLAVARARAILFCDDDIVPEPGFVRAHLGALARFPNDASVSRVRVPDEVVVTPFQAFWRDRMHSGSDRLRDGQSMGWGGFWFVSLCVARDRLPSPAFSESFGYGWEDHELGWRLWRSGVRPRFNGAAMAWHVDAVTLEGMCGKWRTLGAAAWRFARAHPNLTVRAWTGTLWLAVLFKRLSFSESKVRALLETRADWESGPLAARRFSYLIESAYSQGLLERQNR
jgi:glycosyltransferase involved in cell wall biosynthesis